MVEGGKWVVNRWLHPHVWVGEGCRLGRLPYKSDCSGLPQSWALGRHVVTVTALHPRTLQ